MTDVRMFHNPRCRKSREALGLLEEAGVEPEIVLYLETPPNAEELDALLNKLEMEPRELMRRGEAIYKELGLKDREFDRAEGIELLVEHPKLIERPIVIVGDRAVVARPPERLQELL